MATPQPVVLAAPMPSRFGAPLYATDLVVEAASPFRVLEDTFGHRLAWTVRHSHSGFNAPRHHLLRYREPGRRARMFREAVGPLVTARAVVDAVVEGRAEVGPLDAWWHELLKLHEPAIASRLRVVASTEAVPAPPLVGSPGLAEDAAGRLRAALLAVGARPELALDGFAAVPASA
ncbi:phosphate/phosphite/phosphonate ABC transporter substrate-binding protein, partial [Klebsiella aerogenes]|uniref:phosphate/phosphite/phosphonate ABC transporter substrate-binding protein n=1 Tax=Klebsiella aerogenes TaxID=548 RepID=UPI00131F2623